MWKIFRGQRVIASIVPLLMLRVRGRLAQRGRPVWERGAMSGSSTPDGLDFLAGH